MFGFRPLIKEKYDYITSIIVAKQESTVATTKIIGQQDIIEFVDNALASPLTINVLFNRSPSRLTPCTIWHALLWIMFRRLLS